MHFFTYHEKLSAILEELKAGKFPDIKENINEHVEQINRMYQAINELKENLDKLHENVENIAGILAQNRVPGNGKFDPEFLQKLKIELDEFKDNHDEILKYINGLKISSKAGS